MQPPPSLSPETLAAQALGEVDSVSGGLAPAIQPSTNYEQQPDGSYRQDRVYTRADNPTYETAEGLLAALEGAGCACALFASGMAAATAIFQALLPGDHVLVSRVLYWGVRKWLAEFALTWGLDVEFVDATDLEAVGSAIRPGRTRLVWVETPANPMWRSPTWPPSASWPTPPGPGWRSTTPWRPRCTPGRWSSVPTWSCTRPPSTSTATATCWPVRC
jgi:cystathionine gamma-synthase